MTGERRRRVHGLAGAVLGLLEATPTRETLASGPAGRRAPAA
jgi:hypothetical protein